MCLLICAVVVALVFLLGTERGRIIAHHPQIIGHDVQVWTTAHPYLSPLIVIAIYIAATLLMLPVWWIQVLAGCGFGIVWGIIWCDIAATLASGLTLLLARWLSADWYHAKIEPRLQKLHRLNEKMGHNGFMVVMAVRLIHILPFSLSNYLFGLTRISWLGVTTGTLLGNLPAITLYATLGAAPHRVATLEFILLQVVMNLILLTPLALRYLYPDWFKRIGIE
ncbi:MAG: TVP38/TMEM64 family protein [Phycisphaerales bacterium]|nr:TVP38/TMEM64 family protein [Phycisphaerales bacterium]